MHACMDGCVQACGVSAMLATDAMLFMSCNIADGMQCKVEWPNDNVGSFKRTCRHQRKRNILSKASVNAFAHALSCTERRVAQRHALETEWDVTCMYARCGMQFTCHGHRISGNALPNSKLQSLDLGDNMLTSEDSTMQGCCGKV